MLDTQRMYLNKARKYTTTGPPRDTYLERLKEEKNKQSFRNFVKGRGALSERGCWWKKTIETHLRDHIKATMKKK